VPDLSALVPAAASAPSGGLVPAAREVLSTPAARSVAAVIAIALAVLLFLGFQGRFDRSDPKLAGARDGRDLARFR